MTDYKIRKSEWGWTAYHPTTGRAVAHSTDRALLLAYLKDA